MNQKRCFKDPKAMKQAYSELYLKSADEMWAIWKTVPQVLYNTAAIAERCEDYLKMGGMRLPVFDVKAAISDVEWDHIAQEQIKLFGEKFLTKEEYAAGKAALADKVPAGMSSFEFMKILAWQGMRRVKWDNSTKHIEALQKELDDVLIAYINNNYDFSTYFLIVWDYINFARKNKILTGEGRGSGFCSVLLRALGITYGPDPVEHGLIWERFLGFESTLFVKESDFGFKSKKNGEVVVKDEVIPPVVLDDLDEQREVEDDLGGADRY
jgi:DNA polymerase-3 subunit alpha